MAYNSHPVGPVASARWSPIGETYNLTTPGLGNKVASSRRARRENFGPLRFPVPIREASQTLFRHDSAVGGPPGIDVHPCHGAGVRRTSRSYSYTHALIQRVKLSETHRPAGPSCGARVPAGYTDLAGNDVRLSGLDRNEEKRVRALAKNPRSTPTP